MGVHEYVVSATTEKQKALFGGIIIPNNLHNIYGPLAFVRSMAECYDYYGTPCTVESISVDLELQPIFIAQY